MKAKTQSQSVQVQELYLAYRLSYGIREAVQRVAADAKLPAVEVCQQLGLEARFAKPSPLLPR